MSAPVHLQKNDNKNNSYNYCKNKNSDRVYLEKSFLCQLLVDLWSVCDVLGTVGIVQGA